MDTQRVAYGYCDMCNQVPKCGMKLHLDGDRIVRVDTAGLPVSQVSVRASLWALDPFIEHFRFVILDFDVQADRSTTVFVSTTQAMLLSLQIVDVRLRASWAD